MRIASGFASALIIVAVSACIRYESSGGQLASESYSLSNPEDQERLKQGLRDAGVPFTVEMIDGAEHVRWEAKHAAEANAVRISIFGPDLPNGRHIAYDKETQARFESWLDERAIPYSIVDKDGRKYVVWEEAVNERVREWPLPLPPE